MCANSGDFLTSSSTDENPARQQEVDQMTACQEAGQKLLDRCGTRGLIPLCITQSWSFPLLSGLHQPKQKTQTKSCNTFLCTLHPMQIGHRIEAISLTEMTRHMVMTRKSQLGCKMQLRTSLERRPTSSCQSIPSKNNWVGSFISIFLDCSPLPMLIANWTPRMHLPVCNTRETAKT
jgi:hypothetical protein